MELRMIESKIEPGRVGDVEAASVKVATAVHEAKPEGLRWASCLLPDGETFLAFLQAEDGVEGLFELPEYKELLALVEASRAAPPVVRSLEVIGSYRLF